MCTDFLINVPAGTVVNEKTNTKVKENVTVVGRSMEFGANLKSSV